MATYTLGAGERGAYAKTLTPNTVDTVMLARDVGRVEVVTDGTAAVYVTVDGSIPAVAGGGTFEVPAGGVMVREIASDAAGAPVVRLVSAGAVRYSVSELSS